MESNFQLLMLSPNLLKSQSPISWGWVGVGKGGWNDNFHILMLNPNLLKSQSPISKGRGGLESNLQSLMRVGERGGVSNFQKSKAKNSMGGGVGIQLPTFDAESKSAKIPKSHDSGVVGGGVVSNFQKSKAKISIGGEGGIQLQLESCWNAWNWCWLTSNMHLG